MRKSFASLVLVIFAGCISGSSRADWPFTSGNDKTVAALSPVPSAWPFKECSTCATKDESFGKKSDPSPEPPLAEEGEGDGVVNVIKEESPAVEEDPKQAAKTLVGSPHPCTCGCDKTGKCTCSSCNAGTGFVSTTATTMADNNEMVTVAVDEISYQQVCTVNGCRMVPVTTRRYVQVPKNQANTKSYVSGTVNENVAAPTMYSSGGCSTCGNAGSYSASGDSSDCGGGNGAFMSRGPVRRLIGRLLSR